MSSPPNAQDDHCSINPMAVEASLIFKWISGHSVSLRSILVAAKGALPLSVLATALTYRGDSTHLGGSPVSQELLPQSNVPRDIFAVYYGC